MSMVSTPEREGGPARAVLAGDTRVPLRRIEDLLAAAVRDGASHTAVIDGARSFSYAEVFEWAAVAASDLIRHGLAPGDRVSIFLEKTIESVVALFGTWAAGGIVVPINDTLLSRQVDHIVRDSGSRYFISSPRKLRRLEAGLLDGVTLIDVPTPETAHESVPLQPGGHEPAAILYTSGSTGRPKGILISHANLLAGARIVSGYLEMTADDRVLAIPPFNFDYGLNQLLGATAVGATIVLQRSPLAADICRTMEAHEITGLPAVAPHWIQLLQPSSPLARRSFPRLRYATNTGGSLPVEVVRRLRTLLPHVRVYLMYGFSEAFRSTYLPPEEVDDRPTSIGKAIPECEVWVLGPGDRRCAPGEIGELVHRGPTVSLGYWRNPEATAAVFRPNPFAPDGDPERVAYSGDLVKTDEDGYLYFVGRYDEMIKSQGFRISPTEVEEIVFASGLVKEVVAKGEPDPISGAVVAVHCVPADSATFSRDALGDHCRQTMPRYMLPRRIYVHDAFPRTASGKIDRPAIGR